MQRAIFGVVAIVALLVGEACGSNGNGGTGDGGGGGGSGGAGGDGGTAACPGPGPQGPFPFATLSLVAGQLGGLGNTDGTLTGGIIDTDAGPSAALDSARLVAPTGIAFDGYATF